MNALTHPYRLTPVLLAKVRAMAPWCITAPSPHELADEIDNLLDDVADAEVYAAIKPIMGIFSAADLLGEMEQAAKRECGDEPYYQPYVRIDYMNGGYHESGDPAAWERWMEENDAAAVKAGRQFRAVMAAMLRDVERVLVEGRAA